MTNASVPRFLLLAALWGSSFTLIKVALEGLSPGQLVLARLVLGALVLLAVAAVRRAGLPRGRVVWGHLAAAALFGNVLPFLLLSYGERTAPAGLAGVMIGATPLITLAIAAAALAAERATARKVAGMAAGFAGIVLVVGPWSGGGGSLGGSLACFGAAVSYAVSYVYVRRFLSPRKLAPLSLAAGQLVAAAGLQALVTPLLGGGAPHLTGRVLAAIALLGLLSTGLAYVLNFRLIADLGAATASSVNYVVPVVAVLLGVVFLDEHVTWNLVAGGAVVMAGMWVASSASRVRPTTCAAVPVRE